MEFRDLHRWDVSPAEARAIQAELAPRLDLRDAIAPDGLRLIAGVDNAYTKDETTGETTAHAAVVLLTYPGLDPVETVLAARPVRFPYVPGLLSFREGPAVLAAFADLTRAPDLILFDGQGLAHPRRFGLASHLGLILDRPAVGCAKSRLIGTFEDPARTFGVWTPLTDREQTVGAAVRTRPRRAPLFVSPGHQTTVAGAVSLALACCRDEGFMPVPTRLAHEAATAAVRRDR